MIRRIVMIRGTKARARRALGLLLGLALVLALGTGCSKLPVAPRVTDSSRTARPGGTPNIVEPGTGSGIMMTVRAGESAYDVAADYGGSVVDVLPELGLFRVVLPQSDDEFRNAQEMRNDVRVVAAELNGAALTAESRQSSVAFSEGGRTWGNVSDQSAITRIGASRAQAAASGSGVLVAILDTGISFDHPAFAGHLALPGIEPGVTDSPGNERAEHLDSNGDGILDGSLGHGTHVAGIVLAVAPQARLLPVRVLDSDGVGSAFDVAYGIVHAVERGAQVINMSLGLSSPSSAVAGAIRFARDRGVVVVVPTGNDQIGSLSFPASMSEVLAVAGTDSLDHHAWFTNYGYGTDLAAPSTAILSTYYGGGYARWSGTSMAAPFVSGTAALLYGLMLPGDPGTPGQVQGYLLEGACPLYSIDPVFAWGLGAGRVDAAASVSAMNWSGTAEEGEQERRP